MNDELLQQAYRNAFNVQERFKSMQVEEIQAYADSDRLPFGVMSLNLEKDMNISNIIRTAHTMGAESVYTLGWHKVDLRGMVGCQNYTNLYKMRVDMNDINALITVIRNICSTNNYTPVFAEWNEHSRSVNSPEFDNVIEDIRPLLIMGNENKGIPEEIMQAFDNKNIFHIPQRGVIRSMNVAAASAIIQYRIATIKGL